MKCHYEVLEITRSADDTEIKKAYRKLALKWHPDKNIESPDLAKDQFQLVQQAYEVLSDSHERAWYDNHREQILRGGHTNYEDNSLDLFQYFTASCYKGFGDDPGGFYAVYAEVFNKVASEDIEYLETEEEFEEIPKFGDSKSDYETAVRQFYGYWESYCTKKSYAWLNPHNISEIRDRRILKIIEKENRKIQQKARKEKNDEIRSLVAFVRKRDKRVNAYKKLLEEKSQQNRLKTEQLRLEQIKKQNRDIEEQQKNSSNIFNEAYEEQLRKLEEAYTDSEDYESEENNDVDENLADQIENVHLNAEDEIFDEDLYCVACNRLFDNEKCYKNHETSKKHKQNVELLKEEMKKEEEKNQKPDVDEEKQTSKKSKSKKKPTKQESDEDEKKEVEIDILGEHLKEKEESSNWDDGKKIKKSKPKPKEKNPKSAAKDKLPEPKPVEHDEEPKVDIDHVCVTCNDVFDSKNKLFNHLKKTNHGVYIPKGEKKEKSKGGKKKK